MSNDTRVDDSIEARLSQRYAHGFVTDIEAESLPPGLDESVVRWLSAKKEAA